MWRLLPATRDEERRGLSNGLQRAADLASNRCCRKRQEYSPSAFEEASGLLVLELISRYPEATALDVATL